MKLPNLEPLCCMPRPKMVRILWTLRGRLQYILARGLLRKKKNNDNELKQEEPEGDEYIESSHLRQWVEKL